jgi:hypothetical protein
MKSLNQVESCRFAFPILQRSNTPVLRKSSLKDPVSPPMGVGQSRVLLGSDTLFLDALTGFAFENKVRFFQINVGVRGY